MTLFFSAIWIGYALAATGILPPMVSAAFGIPAAFLFPGGAVARLLRLAPGPDRQWLVAPALSPVVWGLLLTAGVLAGLPPAPIMHGVVLVSGLLAIASTRDRAPSESRVGRPAWLVALGFLVFLGAVLTLVPERREALDAWFHTAVVLEIQRAGLPPQDPYFAPLPLQYFWFFHVALLGLGEAAQLSPPACMAWFNALAGFLCAAGAARVVNALGFGRASGAWAGAVFMLGQGGLYWLFFPVKLARLFIGDVTGGDEIAYIFRLTPFTIQTAEGFAQILWSTTFLMRKFLVGTAVSWSLALILLALDGSLRHLTEKKARTLGVQLLAGLGAVLFHVVLGGAVMAAVFVGGLVSALARRSRGALVVAVLGVLAIVLCLPYLATVTQAKEGDNLRPLGFHFWAVVSMPFTVAGVAILSFPSIARLWRDRGAPALFFLGLTVALIGYGLVAQLPGPNQFDKPPILLHIPLALTAGAAIPLWWNRWAGMKRTLFATFVFLFLVPENAFVASAYIADRAVTRGLAGDDPLYAWFRENTGRDAVVVDSHERVDLLVRGPRRQYWGFEGYADQWGYPADEMQRRRAVRDALYSPRGPGPHALDPLHDLDEDVYVIAREKDVPGVIARLTRHPDLERVWEREGTAVFRLRSRS